MIEQVPAVSERRASVDCGWGRLVFGQTFPSSEALAEALREEAPGRRDVCLYAPDPHVAVSLAPHELFIDPSHTYRLRLDQARRPRRVPGVRVRELVGAADAASVNRIYRRCGMVPAPAAQLVENQASPAFVHLVGTDAESGEVVGTVTGVDHVAAFGDPEGGSSLWCLAVDPQCPRPAVGEALVSSLVQRLRSRGRRWLDLSVMHDNLPAIRLYEKLGFRRVPVFCIKRKNPINEPLFVPTGVPGLDELNPYARIIADEALRRGIGVEVLDPGWGELRLTAGGREVVTRESLSELTSAVAMSRCDDKVVTRRVLQRAGLRVPRGRVAGEPAADAAFLAEVGEVVVKPSRGEQGAGITVGVREQGELDRALERARACGAEVLIEERCSGEDLRVVVIGHEVVAAAVRRPPEVVGDGVHTVEELVATQSRRRQAATDGESRIPLDDVTRGTVAAAGWGLDAVLPAGTRLVVRGTANLHTGGTIHDVTEQLHPELRRVAERASRALDVPVTGLDLLVPEVGGPEYVVIEANERPGLANHEPQPTAARFLDLLFPNLPAAPPVGR